MPVVARVDNFLMRTTDYTLDDYVAFDFCHVLGVQKPESDEENEENEENEEGRKMRTPGLCQRP